MKGNKTRLFAMSILLLTVLASCCCGGENEAPVPPISGSQMLRVIIDGREYRGTLNGTKASCEFAALLPLEMEMYDHLRREKVARLPRAIAITGAPIKPFKAGDITYWAPGGDLAIFYTSEAGSTVSGLYFLGTLSGGFKELENAGAPVRVRIELAK